MAPYQNHRRMQRRQDPQLIPTQPSQTHLVTITPDSLHVDDDNDDNNQTDAKIGQAAYLASYNWMARGQRTILVPGCPPRWTPPVHMPRLQEDRGTYYRDKNASQFPEHPMEPGVRSILLMHPDFDGQTTDLFACGSTMGSLLAFVEACDRTFRFSGEKIGKTLFLVRKENRPDDVLSGVYGYGHTFPEAYTTWDPACVGSQSHQRLITYNLGDLRCIIRSETDGYLPRKLDEGHPLRDAPIAAATRSQRQDKDLHELDWSTLSEQNDDADPTKDNNNGNSGSSSNNNNDNSNSKSYSKLILTVRRAGAEVPQKAIFDLKTRSSRNTIDMDEIYARTWANQTPNFVIARHTRGSFDDVQVQDVSASVQDWEDEQHEWIGALIEAVHTIDAVAGKQPDGRIEVRRQATGDLHIWTDVHVDDDGCGALPQDLHRRWRRRSSSS